MYNSRTFGLVFIMMLMGMQSTFLSAETQDSSVKSSTDADYPSYYPAEFQRKGIVRAIQPGKNQLIIDGRRYHYLVDLQVHSPAQKYGSIFNLEKKHTVGFNYKEDAKRKRTITEIWVIENTDYQGL